MKNIFKILSLAAMFIIATVSTTSCVDEVGDIFNGSPSSDARISEAMKNLRTTLLSAPNGWVMEYYGAPDTYVYGGYNIICKFNADSTVTCLSEQMYKTGEKKNKSVTTHFKIEQSEGCILSFDEYNSVIHYFSDPVNPDGIGEKGIGFDGDLEFRIYETSPEKIVMKGKKHNARIVMTPLKADADWYEYFDKVKAVDEDMVLDNFDLYLKDSTITVTREERSLKFRYNDYVEEDDSVETIIKQVCYIVTPEGIKLYKKIELLKDSISGFIYKENAEYYPSIEDPDALLKPVPKDLSEQITNIDITWYLTYSNMGEYGQPLWMQAKKLMDKAKDLLTLAYIQTKPVTTGQGTAQKTTNKFGIYFNTLYNKKTKDNFGYYITPTKNPDGQEDMIKFTFSPITSDKDACYGSAYNYWYTKSKSYEGFDKIIDPFGRTSTEGGRTFKLTTDRKVKPTWIKMEDVDDPTNVITLLRRQPSENPFDC